MTEEEKQELYENICNDISCGTYTLAPQYVDKLLAKLEKENAELKSGCRTCVFTDSPCVPSDYPSKEGVCSHYKNVFEENAELKKKNLDTQDAVTMQMYTNKANKEIADKQLTKAKEIIKDLLLMAKVEHLKDRYETVDEAEQFLNSEVEK